MEYSVKKESERNNVIYEGNPYIKMLKQKLNDEFNNYCVECGTENPEYLSINNGVFICVECVQNHLRFPKNISKIIKNNKNSLTLNEIQCLLCGGNKALLDFINNEFPKLSEFPPNILYRTQAMVYYRQNLQYLINGGVPPIKPSIKYAYSIYNFINNTNQNTNNIINTQKDIYNYNDDRGFLNNIENNSKFYNSGYNFGRNKNNNFENRLSNTTSSGEHIFSNYLNNKLRQNDFQNNNDFLIGNKNENNNNHNKLYSPKRIKVDFIKKRKNSRNHPKIITYNTANCNDIYVKPKLILSPKNNNSFNLTERQINQRNSSVDIIDKNYYKPLNYEIYDKDTILDINLNNSNKLSDNLVNSNEFFSNNNTLKHQEQNENLKKESYVKIKKPLKKKYIHKSLSQKMIMQENGNSTIGVKYPIPFKIENPQTSRIIRQYKEITPFLKTMTDRNNLSKNKLSLNDKEVVQLTKKRNITNTNLNVNIYNKKNEELNSSEIQSLPIKINLKIKKKAKNNINIQENKTSLFKDKSPIERKIEGKKNTKIKKDEKLFKQENKNKTKSDIKLKENKKEELNINKKFHSKRRLGVNKNHSQEDILKGTKDGNKKFIGNKNHLNNNNSENQFSLRNKYKQKTKDK
jgi:ADP-ribosylation factor GTPase-activating protein 1